MICLSRLVLNPRSRSVQRDLADCQDLHRSLLRAFPQSHGVGRAGIGVLFRVEEARALPLVLVQSLAQPEWHALPERYFAEPPVFKRIDGVYERLAAGQRLSFRLLANPTKRVLRGHPDSPVEERWVGKRVSLDKEQDQINWLVRKGAQGGFDLLAVRAHPAADREDREAYLKNAHAPGASPPADVDVRPSGKVHGRRNGAKLTFGSVLLEGHLRVTDGHLFRQTLTNGIGSGKAYGFGLLSIAPA